MNILDWFSALTKGQDPNSAIVPSAFAPEGGPPQLPQGGPSPQVMPPIPQTTAPQGMRTPLTQPQQPQDAPKATQSPPDLANMYIELMRKNQNAQQLDSGLTMIAAGLSNRPENRAALLHDAANTGKGMSLTASDLINFQKQQVEMQNRAVWQAAKKGLMKQYGLTQEEVDAMGQDKMGEVIKHHNTQNLVQVKDANGQTHLVDSAEGKIITTIGSKAPEEGEYVDTPQGRQLMSKRTGQPMGPAVGAKPEEGDFIETPEGKRLMSKRTGQPMGPAAGAVPPDELIKNQTQLDQINKERAALGKQPMLMEEYLRMGKTGVTVNVGPSGIQYPDPEPGHDYVRNPDGTVKIVDGRPTQYAISGSKAELEEQKKKGELDDKAKKDAKEKSQAAFAAGNVGNAVDDALKLADKFGAAGIGSKLVRQLPIGGMSWDTMDAKLNTINSNTAFTQLQQMRAASPTGGALGQVSDFENRMLSSTISDLRAYQDTDSLKKGLIRVKAAMTLLAEDNFKNDPAVFAKALDERVKELTDEQKQKEGKPPVRRVR